MQRQLNRIDGMLVATLLTTLFYSATYPYIHKEIVSNVSDSIIAFNQITNCISIIVYSTIWNKLSDRLFKFYPIFCILETVLSAGFAVWTIFTHNILAYYIIDTLIFAVVTRNICCGGVKLRAIRYKTEKAREHFDNNTNTMAAIATIVGSFIAMLLDLDFNTMLILATIGNCIDNIFYMCIFYSETRKGQRSS